MSTKQPRQALQFVTITNPDEIKDPTKQKAIRRQARRRANGSKPKPFKLTFDLPAVDVHTGPEHEQSITQLQLKVGHGHSIPPRVYEYAGLNAGLPSFDILRYTNSNRGSSMSQMNTRILQLVDFMRQGADGNFCPLLDFWWSIAQMDPTAFFVTLANASRGLSRMHHPMEAKESREAIMLYTHSIQSLQKRLQMPVDGLSQGVIISVLEFAYHDFLGHDLSRWLVHMGGLVRIIRRRGGVQTLYSSEAITLLTFWIDISGSFIFGSPPFFPPPHHLVTQAACKAPTSSVPVLKKWNMAFPELSDITAFMCHAASLSRHIDERAATSAEIWRDDMFISRTFNGVVHQLLSLPRHAEDLEKGIPSLELVMREAMRRAFITLFALLRDKFSVAPSGVEQHRNGVKELLLRHPVDWSAFLELRLWVLLTACLAAEEDGLSWYVVQIKDTMVRMGISGWDEGVEVARSILWMEETFRSRSDRVRDLFELSTVRRWEHGPFRYDMLLAERWNAKYYKRKKAAECFAIKSAWCRSVYNELEVRVRNPVNNTSHQYLSQPASSVQTLFIIIMPSYLITGASRGIGFALLDQLSETADNVVVTIVRNKAATDSKITAELPGRKNIFVLQGDLTSLESIQNAFTETKKILGDSLDVLIANAGLISDYSAFLSLNELGKDPKALDADLTQLFQVNVVGNIHLFNTFLPLIRHGRAKKIVTMSSGMSDEKLVLDIGLFEGGPYSISKSAMNMVNAKFQAEFKDEGILFMGVCPGGVDTGHYDNLSPEEVQRNMAIGAKFTTYAPGFKGWATPKDSARAVLDVVQKATMEANGGQLVSHFGNKQWL
ncbi:putative oxidoreductase [Lachnellula arida]|uniref:Putative oxidoreductase n=1 Tax=Lachnellula arida TaxID=1316785 RepID=A0A8T9B067_9HELO|nr:putative oxidoreductase [Lachnellula arida]